ncbi:ankyrin repeat domain-containing protein 11-like [Hyperolius riggenbachi]|uniref:ankyrin repeat domain-containing protein 11-like n=1 Tax=Hyperolius riggenbachi TaxID=752182 RepID=UPI0035A354BC
MRTKRPMGNIRNMPSSGPEQSTSLCSVTALHNQLRGDKETSEPDSYEEKQCEEDQDDLAVCQKIEKEDDTCFVERDIDNGQCEDDIHNKSSTRRKRPARNVYRYVSSFVEEESTSQSSIEAQQTWTQGRNNDSVPEHNSCEEQQRDGSHVSSSAHCKTVQVKEEELSSGEDDACSEQDESSGDLTGVKSCVIGDTSHTKNAQGRRKPTFVGRSEISEDLRRKVVEAHKNGKGYKSISKELSLHISTVRKIICKWKKFSTVASLPRSGRPTKISAKARRTIVKQMTTNPRVTAKDLQASLALDNICVHESTIRRTLSKWCSWDFTAEEIAELQKA